MRPFGPRGPLAPALLAAALAVSACDPRPDLRLPPTPLDVADLDLAVRVQYMQLRGSLEEAVGDPDTPPGVLANRFGRLGAWFATYRYPASAELAYRQAEALNPADPTWPYFQALLFFRGNEPEAAAAAMERFLELRPDYAPARVHLADSALELGDLDRAESLYREALELDAALPRARDGLARVAMERGEWEEASSIFERLRVGRSPEALAYPLAQVYLRLGRLDEAETLLANADTARIGAGRPPLRDRYDEELRSFDRSARTLRRRASSLAQRGDLRQAVATARAALSADPSRPDLHLALGRLLTRTGRLEEAVDVLTRGTELDPEDVTLRLEIARVLCRLDRCDDGRSHLETARGIKPDDAEVLAVAAGFERQTGNEEGWRTLLLRSAEIDPTDPDPPLRLATAAMRRGHRLEATSILEKALRSRDHELTRLALARVLATRAGSEPEALRRAGELVGRGQENVAAVETSAMIAATSGDAVRATRWQRWALASLRAAGAPETLTKPARERLDLYARGERCEDPGLGRLSAALRIPTVRARDRNQPSGRSP